jgi:hypothetical protein
MGYLDYDKWKLSSPTEVQDCKSCYGSGHNNESDCCKSSFDADTMICSTCNDTCSKNECKHCDGTGIDDWCK